MSLQVASGVVTITTGAIGTTFTISGLAFQPKAIVFVWNMATAAGIAEADLSAGIGFATGTSSRRAYAIEIDHALAGNSNRDNVWRNDCCITTLTTAAGVGGHADLDAINSDGFQLIIDDVFPAGMEVGWIAYGGSDISDVAIVDWTERTTTGDTDVATGFALNTGLDDKAVIAVGIQNTSAAGTAASDSNLAIAIAAGNTIVNAVAAMTGQDSADPSRTARYARTGDFIVNLNDEAGSDLVDCRSTVSAWLADGFRVNTSETNGSAYRRSALVMKGGRWEVGSITTATNTTEVDEATTYEPNSIFAISVCNAESASDTPASAAEMSVGVATSASARWAFYWRDADASASSDAAHAHTVSQFYYNGAAAAATEDGTADLVDFVPASGNGFTWVMDNADPAGAWVGYLASASAPAAASPFVPPSTEMVAFRTRSYSQDPQHNLLTSTLAVVEEEQSPPHLAPFVAASRLARHYQHEQQHNLLMSTLAEVAPDPLLGAAYVAPVPRPRYVPQDGQHRHSIQLNEARQEPFFPPTLDQIPRRKSDLPDWQHVNLVMSTLAPPDVIAPIRSELSGNYRKRVVNHSDTPQPDLMLNTLVVAANDPLVGLAEGVLPQRPHNVDVGTQHRHSELNDARQEPFFTPSYEQVPPRKRVVDQGTQLRFSIQLNDARQEPFLSLSTELVPVRRSRADLGLQHRHSIELNDARQEPFFPPADQQNVPQRTRDLPDWQYQTNLMASTLAPAETAAPIRAELGSNYRKRKVEHQFPQQHNLLLNTLTVVEAGDPKFGISIPDPVVRLRTVSQGIQHRHSIQLNDARQEPFFLPNYEQVPARSSDLQHPQPLFIATLREVVAETAPFKQVDWDVPLAPMQDDLGTFDVVRYEQELTPFVRPAIEPPTVRRLDELHLTFLTDIALLTAPIPQFSREMPSHSVPGPTDEPVDQRPSPLAVIAAPVVAPFFSREFPDSIERSSLDEYVNEYSISLPMLIIIGAGAMSGTATFTFSPSGTLEGAGVLEATDTFTFATTATLDGTGELASAINFTFSAAASLDGAGALLTTDTFTFSTSALLGATIPIAGAATFTFLTSGVLIDLLAPTVHVVIGHDNGFEIRIGIEPVVVTGSNDLVIDRRILH